MKAPPQRDRGGRGGSSFGGDELMQEGGMPEKEIIRLLIEREVARQEKDYAEADQIRDLLKDKDVCIRPRTQLVRRRPAVPAQMRPTWKASWPTRKSMAGGGIRNRGGRRRWHMQ